MMNERPPRKMSIVPVDHYDGQAVFVNHELVYELGGYLGGGAAGVYVLANLTRLVVANLLTDLGVRSIESQCLRGVLDADEAARGHQDPQPRGLQALPVDAARALPRSRARQAGGPCGRGSYP